MQGDPGAPGTCQTEADCPGSLCTDVGCPCNGGVRNNRRDGLVCCQDGQAIPGGAGTCQPADTCIPDGENCGTTCSWSNGCDACCSGFCHGAGNCREPGAPSGDAGGRTEPAVGAAPTARGSAVSDMGR